MLKERTTQHSKRTCKEIHQSIITSDFFLLSPNLYFYIFFNGHVPYYLHPHRHEGIVYILPMNQKETTPSQTWRNCPHSSYESKGNTSVCRVCAAIVPGSPTSFLYSNTKTAGWKHAMQILPCLLFSNLFFPHNSFNFPNLKKCPQSSLPSFVPGIFPTLLLQRGDNAQARCSQSRSPGSLLPQVPGPPSTQQRAREAALLQCCSGRRREWKQLRKLGALEKEGRCLGKPTQGLLCVIICAKRIQTCFPYGKLGASTSCSGHILTEQTNEQTNELGFPLSCKDIADQRLQVISRRGIGHLVPK